MENLQQKCKDPVDLKGTKAALNAIVQQLLGLVWMNWSFTDCFFYNYDR